MDKKIKNTQLDGTLNENKIALEIIVKRAIEVENSNKSEKPQLKENNQSK